MNRTTLTLNRINAFSLAKLAAALYACIGLIVGALLSLISLLRVGVDPTSAMPLPGMFVGAASIIVVPLVYGGIGFVGTLISCAIYNWLARLFGGISFEVTLAGPGAPGASAEPYRNPV